MEIDKDLKTSFKVYSINWAKVKTVDDIKWVLKKLDIRFVLWDKEGEPDRYRELEEGGFLVKK